jgi:hypothetical protein
MQYAYRRLHGVLMFVALLALGQPLQSHACACGCGMFDVGMPGLGLPSAAGGSINIQDTLLDQNSAMQGSHRIPLSQSPDQKIQTNFLNLNAQYTFNHEWGVMAMVPYWQRTFDTNANFGGGAPDVVNHRVNTLSDVRIMGMYTGFSPDMSSGLIFGLKLPTGTYTASGFDRDTQPGTGSTDLLLGGYQVGQERTWGWYAQGMLRTAVATRDGYRPGNSLQLVLGMHYDANPFDEDLIPLLQLNATVRNADSGSQSDPLNSGSKSLYLSPGALYNLTKNLQVNALLYLPLVREVNGIQLVPNQIVSAGLTYSF